jgi:hypothetical protein
MTSLRAPAPLLVLLALTWSNSARAGLTTLDFEDRADGDLVTNQYSGLGVTFANTMALQAGLSLNELEFPPHSGMLVVSDFSGPISGNFSTPVTSFGGYFTYNHAITLTGFAGPDGTGAIVGLAASAFSNNTSSSLHPTNEFLHVDFAAGISSFSILGDLAGGSFVMDDFQFNPGSQQQTAVPEPSSLALFAASGLVLLCFARRRNSKPGAAA